VQLLCTAPFVTSDTITRAVEALLENPLADSLVAVSRAKQYCWHEGAPAYCDASGRIPNSVNLPETTVEAMSLYVVRKRKDGALPTRRYGTEPSLSELDPVEQMDIDTQTDLEMAERLAAGQRAKETVHFRSIMGQLSSTVLADICKDMGISAVLPANIRPTTGGKLMGRAKTLELAAVDPEGPKDAWQGIYGALKSYEFVRQGDVIMVANEVPGRAYFGDLNASLAIRAGAVGAVIDGVTRDTEDVRRLGLPVYAHASHCNDIKFEGTLKAMNAPIAMGDVTIRNDDVVFADEDGVVVVPRENWTEVEERSWEVLSNEADIRLSAARGLDTCEILNRFGSF
jgi:regulator of RNase E activity RraA